MKSQLLKLSGALLGTPLIVTGKGMQHAGNGMHKAAAAVVAGGVVVESAGHATKADFDAKAEAAASAEAVDLLQTNLEKVNKTIAKLDSELSKGHAKAAEKLAELDHLQAVKAELEAALAASPAPVEMLVPAEVAVAVA